jgi:hypothetical protein
LEPFAPSRAKRRLIVWCKGCGRLMPPRWLRFPTGAIGSQCGGQDVVATGGSVNVHIGERDAEASGVGDFGANERGCPASGAAWPSARVGEVLKFGATSGGADAGIAEPAVLGVPVKRYGKRNPSIGRRRNGIVPEVLISANGGGRATSSRCPPGGSARTAMGSPQGCRNRQGKRAPRLYLCLSPRPLSQSR